ncbi:hypothetical protein PCL_05183 [Purpureocillium lilacinum]|uniref:RING-type domain-containing protein n=2 Tax=Purpureocillium lilacinum TaxID=33203 RepID=A0A2U3DVE3_PURLI|nr:hypothetical protein Purlil1_7607 [Purpureocillium lilacinum]PWI66218.1 hypothetical protein PCL_05183 [Purpureocillium lilacinum]
MDPINYMPQSSQRPSPRSDPVHGHGAWLAQTHHFMGGAWPSPGPHYLPSPQPSRGLPGLDPFHVGMQGTLPHPDRSLRPPAATTPNPWLGLASISQNHTWISATPPYPGGPASSGTVSHGGLPPVGFIARVGGSEAEGIGHPNSASLSTDGRRGFMDVRPGTAPVPVPMPPRLQTSAQVDGVAAIVGAGAGIGTGSGTVQGATPEARPPLQFSSGVHRGPLIANAPEPTSTPTSTPTSSPASAATPASPTPSSLAPGPNHPSASRHYPRQRLAYYATVASHASSSSFGTSHDPSNLTLDASQQLGPSVTSLRPPPTGLFACPKAHTGFVEMAEHSRQALSESGSSGLARGGNNLTWDDAASVRQAQLARGAEVKLIASRAALRTLQSVEKDDLPKSEQICVICYNEYNEMSPEGVSEAPLRLPRCKHVFGDHCIKKWFEESDSCPYCRDKLPSEPKNHQVTARAFMNFMRMRGLPPSELDENLYRRAVSGSVTETEIREYVNRMRMQGLADERRSPPDDAAGQDQRRTRRRHRSPSPHSAPEGMPAGTNTEPPAYTTDAVEFGSDEDAAPTVAVMRQIMVLMEEGAARAINEVGRQGSSTTGGDVAGGHQGRVRVPPITALHNPASWSSSQRGRW